MLSSGAVVRGGGPELAAISSPATLRRASQVYPRARSGCTRLRTQQVETTRPRWFSLPPLATRRATTRCAPTST
eukprot:scaffold98684_cov82-Phaeocystis_antarctica.AAC.4